MTLSRSLARFAALVLGVAGLLALGYVAYTVNEAQAFQRAAHVALISPPAADLSTRGAGPEVETAILALPVDGDPVGEVRIDRLGLDAMVVHGSSSSTLRRAVGHLPGTAWPGDEGNVVLAGHRDTFFRALKDVRTGDTISLRTARGMFTYIVEATSVVPPTAVEVLAPTAEPTLTLITCFPFTWLGSAPDRFIVRARETSRPG
ncbi:MAG: class D sortase [Vicinamibacterales bacterium]|nr:class D sortase [Vicinamibacterales bacterium]